MAGVDGGFREGILLIKHFSISVAAGIFLLFVTDLFENREGYSYAQALVPALAIFVVLLLLIYFGRPTYNWIRKKIRRAKESSLFAKGGRFHLNIEEYVFGELERLGYNISGITVNDKATNFDLIRYFLRYPEQAPNKKKFIEDLTDIRCRAFELKYGNKDEKDEKILGKPELGNWFIPFEKFVCQAIEGDLQLLNVLEVGFGTGQAYNGTRFLEKFNSYTATDVSIKSLAHAKEDFPNIKVLHSEAENLPFEASSFDLYISLRTFQSTLFDRRRALHEAARVLRPGGVIIISVPKLYYTVAGEKIVGLSPRYGSPATLKYARIVVDEIKMFLELLSFQKIVSDEDLSGYEILISARLR